METPLKALPNTVSKELPYRCDSVAPHQEIRRVSVKDSTALPTLSALDFAAYYKNPIREAGKQERPENATPLPSNFSSEGFPMLDSVLFSEPEFLRSSEALAWEPFTRYLYAKGAGDSLSLLLRQIESFKWNQREVFADFQKVEKLYLVGAKENASWWVQVDPRSWTGKTPFWAKMKHLPSSAEI